MSDIQKLKTDRLLIENGEMQIEDQIDKLVHELFTWIDQPIVQNIYIKDLQNWDALCAALHIILDLQRPKQEYYSLTSINHLETIGIMQTLYIEQDSIQTLKNAILEQKGNKFTLTHYNRIRDIRNQIFGHPSDKNSGSSKTRHFFNIADENKQLIKHFYWGTIKEIESDCISISDLVLSNSEITLAYLKEIEHDLKNKLMGIMKTYKINLATLLDIASNTFEKLLTKDCDEIAISTYYIIDDEIEKVKEGLIERNVYEDFKRKIEVIVFLSDRLKPLFTVQTFNDIEFYTYASTLAFRIRELKSEIKNIDSIF